MQESFPHYFIINFLPPATMIDFMVAYVGLQQYLLAKEKFKLDRYEKRYQLYEIVRNFLDLIDNSKSIEIEDSYLDKRDIAFAKLKSIKDDAIFIYDRSIYDFLNMIYADGFAYLISERTF